MTVIQQGDVVLKSISEFPEGERVRDAQMKEKILAYGEVTGHAHRLVDPDETRVETFKVGNVIFLNVIRPTMLKHEEHQEIELPPGKYEIGIVRETDHMEGITRQVAD